MIYEFCWTVKVLCFHFVVWLFESLSLQIISSIMHLNYFGLNQVSWLVSLASAQFTITDLSGTFTGTIYSQTTTSFYKTAHTVYLNLYPDI